MKRPIKASPLFKPMSWWDRLWWTICFGCEKEFKGERGWKYVRIGEGGASFTVGACPECFSSALMAEEKYKTNRDEYHARRNITG